MTRNALIATCIVCLLIAGTGRARGLDPGRLITQYAHTSWGPKEGAPAVVTALAQSADGYLWLGSSDGVYRFDGVVFERYQPQSGGPLPAARVNSLLALPNGDLWIGFRSAISLLRNGRATNYTTGDGVPGGGVSKLAQDGEGTIWAATNTGLARLEGNGWKKVGEDWNFSGKATRTVFLDREGRLWVSTEDTLVFLPPGGKRFQATGIPVGQVTQIAQAADGKLWMAETTRSVRPIPLSDKRLPPDEAEVSVGSQAVLFDRDGSLWMTTLGDGLRRSQSPELLRGKTKEFSPAVESFTAKDGLTDDVVLAILQDREGNIWSGTSSGLDGFRKTNLVPVFLPFKTRFTALAAGDAGEIWIQEEQSMFRIHGGGTVRGYPFHDWALSAHTDATGTIWWICQNAIYRYEKGKYSKIALPPSFPKPFSETGIAATEDGTGTLWLAAAREGLFYWKAGIWRRLESSSEYANLSPRVAFTDEMGRAWFGYDEGSIILAKDEKIQRVFRAADSLVGIVRAIGGREKHTWVGGDTGLVFFEGNRFRRIDPADAETFGLILGVEEISDGSLWLAGNRAVIRIPASEVRRALDDPSYRVNYRKFDSFDGLPGTLGGISTNPKEIQGTDGRLWFGASGGIVFADPADVSTNTLPPPVSIRSVRANGSQLDSLSSLALPPRTTNLQIGYTALSLSIPERVRFRYRLEEVDKDWQDAGTRREAFYTRLGPGDYHFRVIACNEDGIWNTQGATLQFSVAPAWFQTIWFRALCAVTFFGLLCTLYWIRLRRMQRQFNVILETQLNERTRIINTIPTLAWSTRPDGAAEFFNQRWLDYTGLTSKQAEGWGWSAAIHPDDLERMLRYWRAAIVSGEAAEIEGRLRRFDGEFRWFLFRANAVRDESGAIVKWYGTNTDIDDRKRAEERVRRSEAFLVEGQRLSRTGTYSWRPHTSEITWSRELYRIFELDPDTPMSLDLTLTRIHPDDISSIREVEARAIQTASDYEHSFRVLLPDGRIKFVHVMARATRDADGRPEFIGAAQDITESKVAEEALNRARSELAHVSRVTTLNALTASIAHEINQPLASLLANASSCLRRLNVEPPNLDGARETAQRTIRDVNRANDVITRLRALFSKKEFRSETLDLNEVTREVIALSLNDLQRSGVMLRSEFADDLPLVIGDRIQLQQVTLNLLRNASDAMVGIDDRPRQLLIRTQREGQDRVCLNVQDSGCGINPQDFERLFEAFYTTKKGGMGIGLSLSRSIIERHHGRLWAEKNDGQPGTTFSFSIPCCLETSKYVSASGKQSA